MPFFLYVVFFVDLELRAGSKNVFRRVAKVYRQKIRSLKADVMRTDRGVD